MMSYAAMTRLLGENGGCCNNVSGCRPPRPRLTPAMADVRRAARASLPRPNEGDSEAQGSFPAGRRGIVVFSFIWSTPGARGPLRRPRFTRARGGGRVRAPRAGVRAGAVIVDHGLQEGSADAAARASARATSLENRPGHRAPSCRRLRGRTGRRPRRQVHGSCGRGGRTGRHRRYCSATRSATRPGRCCSGCPGVADPTACTACRPSAGSIGDPCSASAAPPRCSSAQTPASSRENRPAERRRAIRAGEGASHGAADHGGGTGAGHPGGARAHRGAAAR